MVAYDRRGIGKSDLDGESQTLKHVASSLHALLAQMKVPPPYVLVGHSYGGVLIREFAKDFPTEVKGLVYRDAPDVDMTYAVLDAISPGAGRLSQATSITSQRTCTQACERKSTISFG